MLTPLLLMLTLPQLALVDQRWTESAEDRSSSSEPARDPQVDPQRGPRVSRQSSVAEFEDDAAADAEAGFQFTGAAAVAGGTLLGALLGAVTSSAVLGAMLLVGGVPGSNSASGTVLALTVPFYVFPMLAFPPLGALAGAVVAGLASEMEAGRTAVRATGAAVGSFCGLLLCSLPSWWIFAVPALLFAVVVGGAFILPAIGIAAACAVTTASLGSAVFGVAGAYGASLIQEELGPRGEVSDPFPRQRRRRRMRY